VELPPETCRAVYRNKINCTESHIVGQLLTISIFTVIKKSDMFHLAGIIVNLYPYMNIDKVHKTKDI